MTQDRAQPKAFISEIAASELVSVTVWDALLDAEERLEKMREAAQEVVDSAVDDADCCSICRCSVESHSSGCSIQALREEAQFSGVTYWRPLPAPAKETR